MSPHGQLLWRSVFAPKSAFDLATQHPDPYKLGWIYVAAISIVSLLFDFVVRSLFPANYAVDPSDPGSFWVFDSVGIVFFATTLIYMLGYIFLRWFWRRVLNQAIAQKSIDAAIAVAFACSLGLLFAQYLSFELTYGLPWWVQILSWLVPTVVVLILTSVSYYHAFQMDFARALKLNIASSLLLFLLVLVVLLVPLIIWMLAVDLDWNQALGAEGATQ